MSPLAERLWWAALAVLLGGVMLLDYGFANVGVSVGGLPLPLSSVLLVALLIAGRVSLKQRVPRSMPFVVAGAFAAWVWLRLVLDVPRYGVQAVRDATLAIEIASSLVLGYWAVSYYGHEKIVRLVHWIFMLLIGLAVLYPWRHQLAAAGPIVGLQQPVPLLGTYSGLGTAAAGGFTFYLLGVSRWRFAPLAGALLLGVVIMVQARGAYLALAIGVIVAVAAMGFGPLIRRSSMAIGAAGVAALTLLFLFQPAGRQAPVSPEFLISHVETLFGETGPGTGSIEARLTFLNETLSIMDEVSGSWIWGVGLGPDLVGGIRAGAVAVRKPHDDYLEVFARLGLLGLALLVLCVGTASARLWRSRFLVPIEVRRLTAWILAMTTIYLVIAGTQPLFAYPHGTIPVFLLLGAGIALTEGRGWAEGVHIEKHQGS